MGAATRGVREGMTVYSSDGHKAGRVMRCGVQRFEVEMGFFFPKDFILPYSVVDRVEQGNLHLNLTKRQIDEVRYREENLGQTPEDEVRTTGAPDARGPSPYASSQPPPSHMAGVAPRPTGREPVPADLRPDMTGPFPVQGGEPAGTRRPLEPRDEEPTRTPDRSPDEKYRF